MRKLTFVAGLAAGYVLGARAGRERYEQLAKSARGVAQSPRVQDAARQAKETAGAVAGKAAGRVGDRLPPSVADRVPYLRRKTTEEDGWGTGRH
ncbi:hypothetical protein [Peterkaempfera bronchialis]|uniref:YtxH domain-containing protein n=1 Tax=Peterkaempfera bronchialis TaxID=2126346 RepID=A0A345SUQ5_9ACTN|nr:hypothetical protein [Peterkaempfera bronchialis]AXI77460.1 hypothetical protein C7M71_008420 [Peterkaempfera bronchialis]